MYDAPTEIERIARHRITERTAPTHTLTGSHGSRRRRRSQLAGAIRRMADRLDD
ncbi:MAG: hypothetical protein U0R80_01590 [Nocardioidaceae bacterium]